MPDSIVLWKQLRADFDAIRTEPLVTVSMVHEAVDAQEGVARGYIPSSPHGGAQVMRMAGHRQPQEAYRRIELSCPKHGIPQCLDAIAARAGRLAAGPRETWLSDWTFDSQDESGQWWAVVFEAAWHEVNPTLVAERQLWVQHNGRTELYPYDRDELAALAPIVNMCPDSPRIPDSWLDQLPDAYVSEIGDAASACRDVVDHILETLEAASEHAARADDDEAPSTPVGPGGPSGVGGGEPKTKKELLPGFLKTLCDTKWKSATHAAAMAMEHFEWDTCVKGTVITAIDASNDYELQKWSGRCQVQDPPSDTILPALSKRLEADEREAELKRLLKFAVGIDGEDERQRVEEIANQIRDLPVATSAVISQVNETFKEEDLFVALNRTEEQVKDLRDWVND